MCTIRCGLATEIMSNEICFEGCSKMKKVSSRLRDTNKLSVGRFKIEGLTKMNCYFKTGSTLPQLLDFKLRIGISGFFDPEFRREDSDPHLYTCTDKSLTILKEYVYFSLDCIIVKYGNPGKYLFLNQIFIFKINYGYRSTIYMVSTFIHLKYFQKLIINNILIWYLLSSKFCCREDYCPNGRKKFEKAKDFGNSWYTFKQKCFYSRPSFYKLGEKLNSIYLN
jgi:hypothetical protein